ncbi:AEC family transporter [Ectobacillus funiculus]
MVIQQIVMCTVGVYYAAKGSPEADRICSAIYAVRRIPIVYGAFLGGLFQFLNIPLGESLQQAIDLVANATVPTIMIVLGMQLAKISVKHLEREKISLSLVTKLAISPAIAYVFTLLPVDEMVKQIMIIMAAMPTAANTTMYALQFNTEPEFVASATLLSTSLSLATLPVIFMIVLG